MDTAALLRRTTVRELLTVAPGVINQARRIAHQLYQAGRLVEADVVCRGLIALDHRCAWTFSLHAAVLRRQRRYQEALAQVERGLTCEPAHPKLRSMHDELTARLAVEPGSAAPATALVPLAAPVHRNRAQRDDGRTDSDP